MKEQSPSRRTFLKLGTASAVGILTGEAAFYPKIVLNRAVTEITGQQSGNASVRQLIEDECKVKDNPEDCAQNYQFSNIEKLNQVFIAPFEEEVIFRGTPSWMVSYSQKSENPEKEQLWGTGGLSLNRRELLVGVVSSVVFGLVHNLNEDGVDLKTIPASQTFGGMVYWYLQRKFGIIANTLSHSWNNFRTFNY